MNTPASNPTSDDADILRLLRDSTASFARQGGLGRSRALRDKAPGFDRSAWQDMAEQGWLGILMPEAHGGQGLGFAEMSVVVEELARVAAPEPIIGCAVLAATILSGSDNEALRTQMLPAIAEGKAIIGVGFQAGYGAISDQGGSVRLANGKLQGALRHVDPGPGADGFILAARDGDVLALYYVAANARGLAVKAEPRADGTFSGALTLDGVAVEAGALIAKGQAADMLLRRGCDGATAMVCAALFGAMDAALTMTLEYMKTRVQFGRPIGSFQGLQHRAVDLYIQKELASGALNDAVRTLDDAKASADTVSMAVSRAKSRCGDAGHRIGVEAIKLHGAIGFTDEYDVGLYLRRALALSAALGNPGEHRKRYGDLHIAASGLEPDAGEDESAERVPFSAEFLAPSHAETIDWNSFSDAEFRAGVRAYFERNYPVHLRHLGRRGTMDEMREWVDRISAKKWTAPAWPRQHGGMGLSPLKQLIFIEERERIGIAKTTDQGIAMFGPMLMKHGTEEQKAYYLPKIISNEHIWCQGYSEPNAGSDLASLQTEAVLDGDHYVINGSKIWTSYAHQATHMFLLARTDKTVKKQEGISFFILDLKTPGVTIREIPNLSGHTEFCQEFLDNVRIPKANLVGEINKGWTVAKALLGFERLQSGSPRRVALPLNYLRSVAKSTGLSGDPEFQSKYVKVLLDAEDLASLYRRFADMVRLGKTPGPEISQLKIWAGETTLKICELMIESAGAAGTFKGKQEIGDRQFNLLAPFYTVFGAMIASGSNDIQRNILSKAVLGLPTR